MALALDALHAVQINDEVETQRKMLDEMDKQQSSIDQLLNGTMLRIKGLMSGGAGSHMFVLILFIVFIIVILFFVVGWKG